MKRVNPALNKNRTIFERNAKNLLFTGVKWYKIAHNLTWYKIGAIMQQNGQNYNWEQFRTVYNNWAASKIAYYYELYNVLGIPTPTPELLLYWDQEIKRIEAERAEARRVKREKVLEGKAREAERIAQGGTPRKHNDRRK